MSAAPPAPPPRRPRRRWLRRILLGSLPAFAMAILLGLAYRQIFVWQAERRLAELEAELDATDPGWRYWEMIAARTETPEGQNNARLVEAVARLLPKGWPNVPAVRPNAGEADGSGSNDEYEPLIVRIGKREPAHRLTDADFADTRAELTALAPVLLATKEICDGPCEGSYPVAWARNPMATTLPHLMPIRSVSELLLLDAIVKAQDGQPDLALAQARGILKAARSIGDEPLLISFLVRVACGQLAIRAVEETFGQTPVPAFDAELESLLRQERDDLPVYFATAMRFERGSFYEVFNHLAHGKMSLQELAGGGKSPAWEDQLRGWTYVRPRMRHLQSDCLELMTEPLAIAKLPPEDQLKASRRWARELPAARFSKSPWRQAAQLPLPAVDRVIVAHLKARSRIDATLLALAAERYRLKHNAWPNRIEDLIPGFLDEVPRDCFRDAPLNMQRLSDGLVFYSVGPDGEDDGGLILRGDRPPPQAPGVAANEDIGFRLWNPEARRQPAPPKPAVEVPEP